MKFEEFHAFAARASGYAALMLLGLLAVIFIIVFFDWWKERKK